MTDLTMSIKAEPKHTPGPWQAVPKGKPPLARGTSLVKSEFISTEIRGADGHVIADLRWNGHNETRGVWNARLIAAAPDLLTALKQAVECVEYCRRAHKDAQRGDGVPIEMFWKALIARAEGRS